MSLYLVSGMGMLDAGTAQDNKTLNEINIFFTFIFVGSAADGRWNKNNYPY